MGALLIVSALVGFVAIIQGQMTFPNWRYLGNQARLFGAILSTGSALLGYGIWGVHFIGAESRSRFSFGSLVLLLMIWLAAWYFPRRSKLPSVLASRSEERLLTLNSSRALKLAVLINLAVIYSVLALCYTLLGSAVQQSSEFRWAFALVVLVITILELSHARARVEVFKDHFKIRGSRDFLFVETVVDACDILDIIIFQNRPTPISQTFCVRFFDKNLELLGSVTDVKEHIDQFLQRLVEVKIAPASAAKALSILRSNRVRAGFSRRLQ